MGQDQEAHAAKFLPDSRKEMNLKTFNYGKPFNLRMAELVINPPRIKNNEYNTLPRASPKRH